ncbi:DUF4878 domain-containing protein [Williamsia sp. 1135]|uniref:DUF4878 domain-containing protein n=1 Tax=Williamsia sp. 1135 TaxID=1889262 RepID=UPI001439C5F0|nr:DUF4878 domain-containing protein [Williamsia sp. 1135]
MSYPHGPGSGPAGGGPEWQPYSEPTVAGQPHFGQPQPGNPQYGHPAPGEAYQPYQPYPPQPGQWPAGQSGFGPGGGPPPPRSRKPLIIGLVAGAALLVVVLVVTLVVTLAGGGGAASNPDAAVKTYLQALSDGTAQKALEVMKAPPSDLLLNDDILKKQQEIAKITDIKIVDTTKAGDMATVQATYKYGDRNADETFILHKTGDSWRLDEGAVGLELSPSMDIPELTAFGVAVDKEAKIYYFPGPMEWGSADKNFTVVDTKAKDFPMSAQAYFGVSQLTTELSGTGRNAVQSAITAYLDNCALSKQADASADKPGCGQNVYAYNAEPGSATWTAPTDLSKLEYRIGYDNPEEVSVSGQLPWSVTYRTTATSYRPAENKTEQDNEFLYGKVDLSADPPTFTSD